MQLVLVQLQRLTGEVQGLRQQVEVLQQALAVKGQVQKTHRWHLYYQGRHRFTSAMDMLLKCLRGGVSTHFDRAMLN